MHRSYRLYVNENTPSIEKLGCPYDTSVIVYIERESLTSRCTGVLQPAFFRPSNNKPLLEEKHYRRGDMLRRHHATHNHSTAAVTPMQ